MPFSYSWPLFGSLFKIPFKCYLLWEDTSATPNTKSILSHSFFSEHSIFIPFVFCLLHFALRALPFFSLWGKKLIENRSIAANVQEELCVESLMDCAGESGHLWPGHCREISGTLKVRQPLRLRNCKFLRKGWSPFSFWGVLLALCPLRPGIWNHSLHLYSVLADSPLSLSI